MPEARSDLKPQESLLLACIAKLGGHIDPVKQWRNVLERDVARVILGRLVKSGHVFKERGGYALSSSGLSAALAHEEAKRGA